MACTSPSIIATRAITMGDQYNNQNQYNEAITYYEEYLVNAPELGIYRNLTKESEVYRKLAHAYSTQGNYIKPVEYLEKAYQIDYEIPENKVQAIDDLRQLGVAYSYTGDYLSARKYLNQSLEESEGMESSIKNERKLIVADTYISLSQIELVLGNYNLALDNSSRAEEIYQKVQGETRGLMEADLVKAQAQIEIGQPNSAIRTLQRSIELSANAGLTQSRQKRILANAYLQKGDLENALQAALNALDEAEKSAIIPQIIVAHIKMGDIYLQLGDDESANRQFEKALELQSNSQGKSAVLPTIKGRLGNMDATKDYLLESNSNLGAGVACLRLGDYYLAQNDLPQARQYFEKALSFLQTTDNKTGISNTYLKLSQVSLKENDLQMAQTHIEDAFSYHLNPDIFWEGFALKGELLKTRGNIMDAFYSYEKSISIVENIRSDMTLEEFKTSFIDNKTPLYDQVISLLLENTDKFNEAVFKAFEYSEKARSRTFIDMIANKEISSKSFSDSALLKQEFQLRNKIEKLNKEYFRSQNRELGNELELAKENYNELIRRIKLSNNRYADWVSVNPMPLNEVIKKIGSAEIILEYWLGESGSYVFLLDSENLDFRKLNTGKTEIERNIRGLRNMISVQENQQIQQLSQTLYTQLISPIEKEISQYKYIGIVPHQSIHFLPFQLLRKQDESYLVEDFTFYYLPTTSLMDIGKETISNFSKFIGLSLGDIQIGQFQPLPGTEEEVSHIIQVYPNTQNFNRTECTETSIKNEAETADVIHIATHGVLNKYQPTFSYLLMNPDDINDGQLTVNEIFDLNLKAELVVLSACETGLGELTSGDELTGLSRAFLYAGSRSIIVSLWKVDDAATSLLMTRMHQYLSVNRNPALALAQAQKELSRESFKINQDRSLPTISWSDRLLNASKELKSHPYFWSAFVLIGK